MAYPVSAAFIQALKEEVRFPKFRGTIRNRSGSVRYGPAGVDIVDGDVIVDWTQHMNGPVRTAQVVLADPDRNLDPSLDTGDSANVWFSCKIDLDYGLRLADGTVEWCPIFRGWVEEVVRYGSELRIAAVGKETRQQPPYTFRRPYQADRGTVISQAIIDLLNHRGIDDDAIDIVVEGGDEIFKRDHHFAPGMSVWKVLQHWASQLDKQLYYTADGHIKLRSWPTSSDISWEFFKGEDSVVLEWPEQRLSMSDFFNEAVILTDAVKHDGPNSHIRPEPVVGRATLPNNHALSDVTLNGGNKPNQRFWSRPNLKSRARANQIARQYIDSGGTGLEAEMNLTVIPLPHLEEMDVVKLGFGSAGVDIHKFRLKNFNIPLTESGEMSINWQGRRKPRTKRRPSRRGAWWGK